jgi:hypothetical protein
MSLPATIRAGDTVRWRDAATADDLGTLISSSDWTLTTYLRSATPGNGDGWESTISAATSAGLAVGDWSWGARATKAGEVVTIGSGSLVILPALNYAGVPSAIDGRSQAQQDLDAVQAAIRALISGGAVRRYTIGGRQLEKFSLEELMARESRLKAIVAREKAAEKIAAGLGDPRSLYVRFR